MSNVFTLDSLREETENKFAPTKIKLHDGVEVELRSILRLGKPARESVLSTIDDMKSIGDQDTNSDDLSDEETELLIESAADIFRTIVSSGASTLLDQLDHDDSAIKLSLMMRVLGLWMERAQVGEARNSPA